MKRLLALVCTCLLGIGMLPAGVAAEEPPVAMEVVFVHSKGALNNIRNNPTVCYCLEADLVFTPEDFAEGGAFYNEGRGWIPIGDRETPFSGWLQGNGHTISGLQCTASEGGDLYGLFGVSTGLIEGLTVDGFSVTGTPPASASVGTIAAENDGTIAGCAGGGSLAGPQPGGIVGRNRGEVIGCVNFGEVRLESPGVRRHGERRRDCSGQHGHPLRLRKLRADYLGERQLPAGRDCRQQPVGRVRRRTVGHGDVLHQLRPGGRDRRALVYRRHLRAQRLPADRLRQRRAGHGFLGRRDRRFPWGDPVTVRQQRIRDRRGLCGWPRRLLR